MFSGRIGQSKRESLEVLEPVGSKFKCQNIHVNDSARTKMYHRFINIIGEGAATNEPGRKPSIKNPIPEKRAS